MLSEGYLNRRYRADTFEHFQTPVYYLGKRGWHVVGKPTSEYPAHRLGIEQRSERTFPHTLAVQDVLLKFLLESDVRRIIRSEDELWRETIDLGNIPDAWIQYGGGEGFIEIDLGTEHAPVFKQKIDRYEAFKWSGHYQQAFPGCCFRVLVITTTDERIEALEKLTTSDDIWYAAMEEFLRERLDHQHWFALNGFYALPVAPKKEV